MPERSTSTAAEIAAYREGQRAVLSLAALAIALMSFINLLSVEKSLLALVFAAVVLRGGGASGRARLWARAAIFLAIGHWIVLTVILSLFHKQIGQLLSLLQTVG